MAEGFKAGSIFAELKLDKGQWTATVKEIHADTEKLKKSASSWGDGVKKVGTAFTVAGAVVVGSLVAMIKKTADAGDQINDLSQRFGISHEVLSSYKLIADQTGTSLEGVAKGLKGLAANMVDAKNGTGEGAKAFKELGLTAIDSHGKLKPLDSMMMEIADRFAGMEAGAAKSDMAVRLFGKSGLEMIPMLDQGSEGLRKNREQAERLGMVFTKQAALAADEFNDRLTELKFGLAGSAKEIAMSVMPTVTDFIKKITDTIVKVREWTKAHPELTKLVTGLGLKVGVLLTVVGPLLIIIPKIIKLKNDWAASIRGLHGGIGGLAGNLGKIAAVGGAAFAGWQIGRLIGELTGLDKVMEGVFDKTFRFIGIIKDSKSEVGSSAAHIAAAAKQQEIFARAFEISGQKVERLPAAIAILTEEYKKHGTTGSAALDAIAKGHLAAEDAEAKHRKSTELIGPATEAALEAQKKWTEFLQTAGIMTIKEKTDRLGVLGVYMKNAEDLYKSGKISAADYAKAIQAASGEAAAMGMAWTTALPPARNLMDVVRQMPSTVDSAVYAYMSFEDQVKDTAEAMDVSQADILRDLYNIRREFLALAGITLPPIDYTPVTAGAKGATDTAGGYFAGLYNDIARGFGDTVQKWATEGMSLRGVARDLWRNIKSTFFTAIGEMTSGVVLGQFKSLFAGIMKSGEDAVGSAAGSIGKSVTGIASGLGTLITTLATAIATAATTLAAAAPAIITVGLIAMGLFAGFKLIGSIIGGGGGKQTDVTYWLKLIKDNSQILVNFISGNYLDLVSRMTGKIESLHDDKFGALLDQQYQHTDFMRQIASNTENTWKTLEKAKFAQSGYEGLAGRPTLIVAGESRPEWVSIRPLSEPRSLPLTAGARAGSSISVINNISVRLDPLSDREMMRRRFMPELLAALEANYMKSQIRQQLGA